MLLTVLSSNDNWDKICNGQEKNPGLWPLLTVIDISNGQF